MAANINDGITCVMQQLVQSCALMTDIIENIWCRFIVVKVYECTWKQLVSN